MGGSPLGIKVSANECLEKYMPSLELPPSEEAGKVRTGSEEGLGFQVSGLPDDEKVALDSSVGSMAIVDNLIAKYGMSKEDGDSLRMSVTIPSSSSTATGRRRTSSGSEGPKVRTAAPVQLLASTRRLAEFSSSRVPKADDTIVYVSGAF